MIKAESVAESWKSRFYGHRCGASTAFIRSFLATDRLLLDANLSEEMTDVVPDASGDAGVVHGVEVDAVHPVGHQVGDLL